ncbi:MAG: GNAT family N-acetyltransferase [Rhodospirillales bacterium]
MRCELIRIEDADPAGVGDLLAREADEWHRLLHWDREAPRRFHHLLARRHDLPGWLVLADGEVAGKVLVGAYRRTRTLENPYVMVEQRGRGCLAALLEGVTAELASDRQVERVETGFFAFGEEVPEAGLAHHGWRSLPRRYMLRSTASALPDARAPARAPARAGVTTGPGRAGGALSGVLHAAYQTAPDREAVEVYRTRTGCARYLDALCRGGSCGALAAPLSARAVDGRGHVVGFLLATRIAPSTVHVAQIAVRPEWQAQRLGTALLDRFADEARRAGATRATLLVTDANEHVRAWYGRRGYRDLAPFHTYWWERSARPVR